MKQFSISNFQFSINFPAYRQAGNEQISQLKNWIIEVLFENCELKIDNFFFPSISKNLRVCSGRRKRFDFQGEDKPQGVKQKSAFLFEVRFLEKT